MGMSMFSDQIVYTNKLQFVRIFKLMNYMFAMKIMNYLRRTQHKKNHFTVTILIAEKTHLIDK